jgi:hypothetical protein
VWERINIGTFLLWVAVLALTLWRLPATRGQLSRRPLQGRTA